jgi:hypothetical protein
MHRPRSPRLALTGLLLLGASQAGAAHIPTQVAAWSSASATGYGSLTSHWNGALYPGNAYSREDAGASYAEATVQYGLMRNRVHVATHATGITGDEHTAVGNTETHWVDSVLFRPLDSGGTTTTAHFHFYVDGSTSVSPTVNLATSTIRYAFDLYDYDGNPLMTELTGVYGISSYGFTEGSDFRNRWIDLAFELPPSAYINYVTQRLVFMAGAAANATQPGVAEDVYADVDLSHTIRFGGMTFESGGTPVAMEIDSESGFDWGVAYEAPAPASLALLVLGLVPVAARRRRRLAG